VSDTEFTHTGHQDSATAVGFVLVHAPQPILQDFLAGVILFVACAHIYIYINILIYIELYLYIYYIYICLICPCRVCTVTNEVSHHCPILDPELEESEQTEAVPLQALELEDLYGIWAHTTIWVNYNDLTVLPHWKS
jgi:hypothetical protein